MPSILYKKIHPGFTLAELLIVVSIVVILGIIALIGINPSAQIFRGFDTRRRADLNKIKIAFEGYYSDKGCYPPASVLSQCGSNALSPYLPSIPCDPNDGTPYKIKIVPEDSVCPQAFAIYTTLYSFFSKLSTQIDNCPDTFAVYSENMNNVDLIQGCSGVLTCVNKYGCINGSCALVAVDQPAPCRPSYCDSDCGEVNCQQTNKSGRFINECVSF